MKQKFSWRTHIGQSGKIVGLAPMESITDSPFRLVCRRFGAEVVFTEMVSADGLVRREKEVFKKLRFRRAERPIIGQLVGNDPEIIAEGAQILSEEVKVDGVDLNLACPARAVIRKGGGGAWLKNPEKIIKLLNIVRRKTNLPLSAKLRSGFQKPDILDWIEEVNKTGVEAVILHPRTVKQKFTGKADWSLFAKVKQKLSVPLIASGDIFSQVDLAELFSETPVDGALIARGARGNPWIFEGLEPIKENPKKFLRAQDSRGWRSFVPLKEKIRVIREHFELALEFYQDERITAIVFRKHLLWYLRGIPFSRKIKPLASQIASKKDLLAVLEKLKKLGEKTENS
ncbi:tRNA-dihydrouridine synthase family protein [bacterium]|nr:tRNA-dihydrouridine synthase family protein [bacterium]